MFDVAIEKMTKNDWINLLNLGWDKGLVKIITDDEEGKFGIMGVACNIGENAFYFCDADEYEEYDLKGAKAFVDEIGKEKIIDMIATGLLGMQNDYQSVKTKYDTEFYGEFDPEYEYYHAYLSLNV